MANEIRKAFKNGDLKIKTGYIEQVGKPETINVTRTRRNEIELFRNALAQVELEKKKSLLVHAVRRAYKDNSVLIALLKKILPDKIESEVNQKIIELHIDGVKEKRLGEEIKMYDEKEFFPKLASDVEKKEE